MMIRKEQQSLESRIFVFLIPAEPDNEAAINGNDNDITNDADIMIGCDFDAKIWETATHVTMGRTT